MGGNTSKGEPECSCFSEEEAAGLRESFDAVTHGAAQTSHKTWGTILDAKILCQLLKILSLNSRSATHGPPQISYHGYSKVAAQLLKGSADEQVAMIMKLCTDSEDSVTAQEMIQYVKSIADSYLKIKSTNLAYQSWDHDCLNPKPRNLDIFALSLLHDLLHKGNTAKHTLNLKHKDSTFTVDDIESWFLKCPHFMMLQNTVFHHCFNLPQLSAMHVIPQCKGVPAQVYPSIFDIQSIMFLNFALPRELKAEWRLLFSSRVHGESFSNLLSHVIDKGPSVIVVRDKDGFIFGGFASQSWALGPQFTGTEDCFLFSLAPKMAIYSTTGYNDHYMYLNIHQQTMPNGLGMGGQLECFGLWIDSDYGKGSCSPSCTTFHSPQLSVHQHFEIDHTEVWGVGPEPKKVIEEDERPSILDVDAGAKAMLTLMGHAPVSEGMREEDPMSSIPEETVSPTG